MNSGLLSVEIINEKLAFMFCSFQLASFNNRASDKERQLAETLDEVKAYRMLQTYGISHCSKVICSPAIIVDVYDRVGVQF